MEEPIETSSQDKDAQVKKRTFEVILEVEKRIAEHEAEHRKLLTLDKYHRDAITKLNSCLGR